MTFLELINKRESCRAYKDIKVEREKIISCIEAARLAPSACNSQPWHFVVVDDQQKVKEIASSMYDKLVSFNKFAETSPAFIVVIEEKATLSAKLGGKMKDQHYAPIDIGLATENICLMAAEQNLSTCIMGWFNEKSIKKYLEIGTGKRIRLVIAIGYGKND